jgi:hypothetical protein
MSSQRNPRSSVPWATDDQWPALQAEANRMSLELQKRQNAVGPSRKADADGRGHKQDLEPAGSAPSTSVFWEPLQPQKILRFDLNPYEGVLGPGIGESGSTQKVHKRADISKLIKTGKDVWKAGKQPTQTYAGKLPGAESQIHVCALEICTNRFV